MRRLALSLVLLMSSACVGDVNLEATPIPGVEGEVTAEIGVQDQTTDGMSITIPSVSISGSPGWVVVHKDVNGAPGMVVGHVAIPEGSHADVVVAFEQIQAPGVYWPMVHVDTGTVGEFEFPHPADETIDAAVLVEGEHVMDDIQLTVSR